MNTVYLALGTNLGNRAANLEVVHQLISSNIGIVSKESTIYETAAWGVEGGQPVYWNQVLCIKTILEPLKLLEKCQLIEKKMGRIRTIKWAPRIMDIDILFFNDRVIKGEALEVPHPLLQERNFVLVPLCEIAGDLMHPVLEKNITELRQNCGDELPITPLKLAH